MFELALRLGFRGLLQHFRRNLLLALALLIGTVALLSVIGFSVRFHDYLSIATIYVQKPGHLAVIKSDGLRRRIAEPIDYSLTQDEISSVIPLASRLEGYQLSAPFLFAHGLIGNGCESFPFLATGLDFEAMQKLQMNPELKRVIPGYQAFHKGQDLWDSTQKTPVGLGTGLLTRLGKRDSVFTGQSPSVPFDAGLCARPETREALSGDANVQLIVQDFDGRMNASDAQVTQTFSTGIAMIDASALSIGIGSLRDLLHTDGASYLAIFLDDQSRTAAARKTLEESIREAKLPLEVYAWNDPLWNFNYYASFNILLISNLMIAGVVLLIAVFSIINTIQIGLVESRREIGTLRALGYLSKHIALIYACEALLLAIVSTALGCVLGQICFSLVAKAGFHVQFPGSNEPAALLITAPPWAFALCAAALCLLAFVSSYILSRRYAGQPPLRLLDRGQ